MPTKVSSMSVSIRPAEPGDLSAIHSIYEESVLNGIGTYELDPPGLDEMMRRYQALVSDGFPYIVAVDENNAVLGYAYASRFRTRPAYDWLCEDSVYVSPEARGRKVGRMLLDALLAAATMLGFRQMVAVIGGPNPASVALHEAVGFTHSGRMKASGFKHGRWLDTVIMQLPLGEGSQTLPTSRPNVRPAS